MRVWGVFDEVGIISECAHGHGDFRIFTNYEAVDYKMVGVVCNTGWIKESTRDNLGQVIVVSQVIGVLVTKNVISNSRKFSKVT